jgi:ribosome-associated toxin RatA of RatAB toxin-antitoxin module
MKMTIIEGFKNPKNHLNTTWKVPIKRKNKIKVGLKVPFEIKN